MPIDQLLLQLELRTEYRPVGALFKPPTPQPDTSP